MTMLRKTVRFVTWFTAIAGMAWLAALALLIGLTLSSCSADCSKVDCKTSETKTPPALTGEEKPFDLKGSVTSAFAVNVDGVDYDDMEAYYTQTVNTLDRKVQQLGYDGYSAKLTAQLGYADLSTGMSVYVTPATDRGYQGKTYTKPDGTFSLTLPGDASGDTYQVKATKRIRIVLTNKKDPKDIKWFCFNFSGVDLQVPYNDKDKPIVLSKFKSTVTTYGCLIDPKAEGDLPIPEAPAPEATPTPPAKSDEPAPKTKEQVDQDILNATLEATKPK